MKGVGGKLQVHTWKKVPRASETQTCSSYAYKTLTAHSLDDLLEQPRASAESEPEVPASIRSHSDPESMSAYTSLSTNILGVLVPFYFPGWPGHSLLG